jgi:hypothetical protein
MTEILIDGYDFTNDVKDLPFLDENVPEWGQIGDQILNETMSLVLPTGHQSFFDGKPHSEILVEIKRNGITQFEGFIDNIVYDLRNLTINCKGYTSVLFNGYLTDDGTAYVIDDAYPADIVKEILTLAGLTMNERSYNEALSFQKALDMKFSVTTESLNYAELLEKVAEVTCGIIYVNGTEFHYEMYNPNRLEPSFDIDDADWVVYPTIETPPAFSSVFNGVDVIFGNGTAQYTLFGRDEPSKQIDMSASNSAVYTGRLDVALYIAELYDYIGNHQKYELKGTLRKAVGNILQKKSAIKWDGKVYEMININNQSSLGTQVLAEAIV